MPTPFQLPAWAAMAAADTARDRSHRPEAHSSRYSEVDPTDPHTHLRNFLHTSPYASNGHFSNSTKVKLFKLLYQSSWYKPEWLGYFWVDGEPWTDKPMQDWIKVGENGQEVFWSLKEYQKGVEERARAEGRRSPGVQKRGRTCGKMLKRFERTYSCRTCAIDQGCVLCVDCFKASDHDGHEVLFGQTYTFATSCDCGDRSAWRDDEHLGCSYHPPLPHESDPSPVVPKSPLSEDPAVPDAVIRALYETIVICLEFIIKTAQHSHLPMEHGILPKDETEMRGADRPTGEAQTSRSKGPWGVTLWADEKHVVKEVARQIRDAIGIGYEEAERFTKEVEDIGRKVVLVSTNPISAFHAANMFQQIDLGVSLRLASDTFREEACGAMINWLTEMCQCTIGSDSDLFKRILLKALLEPRLARSVETGTALSADLKDLEYDESNKSKEPRRLDWLMQLDVRLWRRAKWELRQIYTLLYHMGTDPQRSLASRFSYNYVRLYEHYLFQDREVDTNLVYSFAHLVFNSGQGCVHAAIHGNLVNFVIDVAQAYYTNQVAGGALTIPPKGIDTRLQSEVHRPNTETTAFRGKKGLTIFAHIRGLFRTVDMQKLVMSKPAVFDRFAAFINIFVGLQTQRREITGHVEYEIEWTKAFAILAELSKCCREVGAAARWASPTELLAGMGSLANRMLSDAMLQSTTLDPEMYKMPILHEVKDVLVHGSSFTLLQEEVVHIKAFSFHHYLHYFFAELLKWVGPVFQFGQDGFRGYTFRALIDKFILRNQKSTEDADKMLLTILEYPLRMYVILSQIRADMWKKNGVAMRGQHHHYREISIRDSTLDQDFYLLQFGLCTIDPFKFIVAILDRFALCDFFRGDVLSVDMWDDDEIEPKQRIFLLEDFLLLIIHLVTDTASINHWSQQKITRTHIIHQLAVNNATYSELIKRLPERSLERRSILPILTTVADFREPTETVPGQYSLKPELLDEVDPYWRHYTRNEQRVAMDKVLGRLKKLDPSKDEFYMPKPLDIPPAPQPFSNLGAFLESHVVAEIVHYTIAHAMPIANLNQWPGIVAFPSNELPQLETMLDLSLHLCLIALQRNPKQFAESSVEILDQSRAMSIFQNLWYMQTNDNFKTFLPKVDYIMATIVANLPESYTTDYRSQRAAETLLKAAAMDKPDAKSTAAARQKAIMAEFARKQQSFAALTDVEDEDEDMAEEETVTSYGQCIVCQDDVTAKAPGGMLALLQPSRVLREVVMERDWFEESLSAPVNLDEATRYPRYGMSTSGEPESTDAYPSSNLKFGVYMSACSHLMHDECMATYFDATRYRHTSQVQRHHPENAVRMEYMCPLCKSLGNVLVPLETTSFPLKSAGSATNARGRLPTLSESIRSVSEEGLLRVTDSTRIWDHHVETGELVPWFSDCSFSLHSLDPLHRKQHMRPVSRMVDRIRALIRPLSEQSSLLRSRTSHMYMPDEVVSYTVSICEVTQRGLPRNSALTVAEQVPEMSIKLIKKLIGMLQLELDLFFGPRYDRTALRVGLFARFLPDWYRSSSLPSPLLCRNPLGIVMEAAAIAPDLLQPVIALAYYAELTRCMLGLSLFAKRCLGSKLPPTPRTTPPVEENLAEALEIFSGFKPVMQSVLRSAGPFTDTEGVLSYLGERKLSKLLYSHTLPFLRRAAIVYYAVAGTYPVPEPELGNSNGCEYNRLLSLMGIPQPRESLQNPNSPESPIVARWLTQWSMQGRVIPSLEFPGTYELARLPRLWEDVVLRYIDKRCDVCGMKPTYPALCLNCGKFLCLGGDCCAQGEQGECNIHMRECGAAVGMFADIKRWVILYLYAGSGSFGYMPYLDPQGELDLSNRRGHRQIMHVGRMDDMRRGMWLQHTIPHYTARRLELMSDGGGWGCL